MKQVNKSILFIIVLINVIVISEGYTRNENWYWVLVITLPLLLFGIVNIRSGGNK